MRIDPPATARVEILKYVYGDTRGTNPGGDLAYRELVRPGRQRLGMVLTEVFAMFVRSSRHVRIGVPAAGASTAGFSLIEVLIAMALAGLLMIGVLPLFTKSMANNVEGNQLTEVTNRARLHVEELMAMPVDAEELTVPDGDDELVQVDLFSPTEERWIDLDDYAEPGDPLYTRTTRVRQFNMSALSNIDFEFEDDEVLPGGTPASQVGIKEIVVRVNTGRPTFLNLMGRQKAVTLRVLKSV